MAASVQAASPIGRLPDHGLAFISLPHRQQWSSSHMNPSNHLRSKIAGTDSHHASISDALDAACVDSASHIRVPIAVLSLKKSGSEVSEFEWCARQCGARNVVPERVELEHS
jgi:hypothetical protein